MFNKKVEPYPIRKLTPEETKDIKHEGTPVNILTMLDNGLKEAFHYNDKELDRLCLEATDEEISLVWKENKTYSEAKQLVLLLNKFRN